MADAALYSAILGIWIFVVMLSLWIFYLLRQDSALEHRSVPLTMFSSIVSVILTTFYLIREAYHGAIPCWLGLWFESILWPLWWSILVCRCGRLIFLHRSTRSKLVAALTLVQRKSSTFARSLASRKSFGSLLHSPSNVSLAHASLSSRSRSFSGSRSTMSTGTSVSNDRRRRGRSSIPPVPPLPAFLADGTIVLPTPTEVKPVLKTISIISDSTAYLSTPAKSLYGPSQTSTIYHNGLLECSSYSGIERPLLCHSPSVTLPPSRAHSYFAEPKDASHILESISKGDNRNSNIGGVFEVLEREFCYRHRVWVSTKWIFMVIFVLTIIFIVSTGIAYGVSDRMKTGLSDSADCRFGPEFYPMHIFAILYSLCALPIMLTVSKTDTLLHL
ncbi:hypothetical protein BDF19DRAFT_455131, partial [Syncephalis fuscata]